MIAALADDIRDLFPRKAAENLAVLLGVSHRTARRYVEQPHLIPISRAERFLAALEQEEAALEARRAARRQQREAVRNEIRSALGLDGPRLDMHANRLGPGLAGREGGEGRGILSPKGHSPVERRAAGERQ